MTSAELKAAAKGAKKTRMIYNVMSEIGGGLRPRMVPILFGDNAAAVQVTNNDQGNGFDRYAGRV